MKNLHMRLSEASMDLFMEKTVSPRLGWCEELMKIEGEERFRVHGGLKPAFQPAHNDIIAPSTAAGWAGHALEGRGWALIGGSGGISIRVKTSQQPGRRGLLLDVSHRLDIDFWLAGVRVPCSSRCKGA